MKNLSILLCSLLCTTQAFASSQQEEVGHEMKTDGEVSQLVLSSTQPLIEASTHYLSKENHADVIEAIGKIKSDTVLDVIGKKQGLLAYLTDEKTRAATAIALGRLNSNKLEIVVKGLDDGLFVTRLDIEEMAKGLVMTIEALDGVEHESLSGVINGAKELRIMCAQPKDIITDIDALKNLAPEKIGTLVKGVEFIRDTYGLNDEQGSIINALASVDYNKLPEVIIGIKRLSIKNGATSEDVVSIIKALASIEGEKISAITSALRNCWSDFRNTAAPNERDDDIIDLFVQTLRTIEGSESKICNIALSLNKYCSNTKEIIGIITKLKTVEDLDLLQHVIDEKGEEILGKYKQEISREGFIDKVSQLISLTDEYMVTEHEFYRTYTHNSNLIFLD